EKSEDEHGEKGLQDDPSDADDGLLIADFNVAPHEEVQEFAVAPELAEAKLEGVAWRLDTDDGGRRRGKRKSGRRCGRSDRSHRVRADDSESELDPESRLPEKRRKELVGWMELLELLDVAIFDLAHQVVAMKEISVEAREERARNNSELVGDHLAEI